MALQMGNWSYFTPDNCSHNDPTYNPVTLTPFKVYLPGNEETYRTWGSSENHLKKAF